MALKLNVCICKMGGSKMVLPFNPFVMDIHNALPDKNNLFQF